MSSEPSDVTDPQEPKSRSRRKRPPFETWRKIALSGAVLLLLTSVLNAWLDEDFPGWLYTGLNSAGYVILAISFGSFYRERRERLDERNKKELGL